MGKSDKSMNRNSGRQTKIVQKRTTLLEKLAYILRPYVVYMLVKTVAMLLLALAIPNLPISGITQWIQSNASLLSAVVNGIASMIAVCFVLNDFLIEANTAGEVDIDKGVPGQLLRYFQTNFWKRNSLDLGFFLCIVFGVTASLAVNILIQLVSNVMQAQNLLGSDKYDAVKTIQYSVPLWLGLILYGLVSPMVEEIVFRGITYSRIRRFYGIPKAVICSALLFGLFHGNLPQFVYGSIMGGIMAVCYELMGCLAAPVLVHMAANIFIFVVSGYTDWTAGLMTPMWCGVFLLLSCGAFWGIWVTNGKG